MSAATPRAGVNRLYEELESLTGRMAAAARASRWQEIVDLVPGVVRLNDAIRAEGPPQISGPDMQRRATLTRAVLRNLAEIDGSARPWLTDVRQLLGSGTLSRRVKSAYRSPG